MPGEGVPRASGEAIREAARALQRPGLGDAHEHAVERPAEQRRPDSLVDPGREEQWQRRRALAEVGAADLPGLQRVAGAIEDVVRDLEGDTKGEAEPGQPAIAAAEHARRLEELAGLELA